jgi:trigger factor
VPEAVNQALIGMSVGEEKDLAEVLPEDYPNEELRGKDVTYHITVHQVKEQTIPELTDEFARKLGDYENVQALREAVDKNLRSERSEQPKTTRSITPLATWYSLPRRKCPIR